MDGEKHNLAHEFQEFHDQIQVLKQNDSHFTKLLNQHDELDAEIRRSEAGIDPRCDEHLVAQKVQRLALKDELYNILKKAAVPA